MYTPTGRVSAGQLVDWSAGRLVGWSAVQLVSWSAGRIYTPTGRVGVTFLQLFISGRCNTSTLCDNNLALTKRFDRRHGIFFHPSSLPLRPSDSGLITLAGSRLYIFKHALRAAAAANRPPSPVAGCRSPAPRRWKSASSLETDHLAAGMGGNHANPGSVDMLSRDYSPCNVSSWYLCVIVGCVACLMTYGSEM